MIPPEFLGILENDAIMIATMGKAVKDHYGDEGLKILQEAMEEKYKRIVPAAAKHAGARLNDGSIEDWVKVETLFGKGMGIEGDFEITPTQGIMRVTQCPYAKQYGKVYPGICPEVLIGCERAIAKTINPKLQVRGQKYLTQGDDICELIVEFEE